MTGSAAALEDLTRWLGVLIAVFGAFVANPEATRHLWGRLGSRLLAWAASGRAVLRRLHLWRRREPASGRIHAGAGAVRVGPLTGYGRGIVGWPPRATLAERINYLDQRTRAMDKELGELQQALRKTEKTLRTELAQAVATLRAEADQIRATIAEVQAESVRLDAAALPVIVCGVVLGGIAPDAQRFQVWFWLVVLMVSVAFAVGSGLGIISRARRRASQTA